MTKIKSLSRQISLVTGIVSTAVIIFTSLTFSMAYYILVQHDSRSLLIKEASEIIQEHIIYSNGVISLRDKPPGESLIIKLQNFSLSAAILNTKFDPISANGIYQGLTENKKISDYTNTSVLVNTLTNNKLVLTTHVISGKSTYETLVAPIIFDNKTLGILVLSKPYEFINQLLQLNLIVLAFSVPLSLLLGWVLSVTTIKSAFTPLNKLVNYIDKIQFTTHITKLEYKEDPGIEISSLTNAFNDMVARVGESLEKQKNFVANASHELKTPLTQAISSLDLAKATNDPKYITQVKEDLMSLNQILDSLLAMSKVSSLESPILPITNINILAITTETLNLYKKYSLQKNLEIQLNIPANASIRFTLEHFKIIIKNLVSNAIKYNVRQGLINITWKNNSLTVSDTGIGMETEEKEHMFDRFYRGRHKLSSTKGTGLGLALVKLIADNHHLVITVTSLPKKGTSISVTFPNTSSL